MPPTIGSVYDRPLTTSDEDRLGRRWFTSKIVSTIHNAPAKWSTRIAIVGEWGEGKTSTLNIIKNRLLIDGFHIVELAPWDCSSSDEMLARLFEKTNTLIMENQKDVANYGIRAFSKIIRTLLPVVKPFFKRKTEDHIDLDEATKRAIQILDHKSLAESNIAHTIHKAVVFLDDLDRVDPKIIPKLLLSIRELLNVPGTAFILSFDPVVVGEALVSYHHGWSDAHEFLRKIVDFQFSIPRPSEEMILRLVTEEIELHCDEVPTGEIKTISKFLPRNPRAAKAYVRQIWGWRSEIKRRGADDVDWPEFLISTLMRSEYPQLARVLAEYPDSLPQAPDGQMHEFRILSGVKVDIKKEQAEFEREVENLLRKAQIPQSREVSARLLAYEFLRRLGGAVLGKSRTIGNTKTSFVFQESPTIATQRECDAILDSNSIQQSVAKHCEKHQSSRSDVVELLIRHSVFRAYRWKSRSFGRQSLYVKHATPPINRLEGEQKINNALKSLDEISEVFPPAEVFQPLLEIYPRKDESSTLRAGILRILHRLGRRIEKPVEALNYLYVRRNTELLETNRDPGLESFARILASRCESEVTSIFRTDNSVDAHGSSTPHASGALLFDIVSPLWTVPGLLRELVDEALTSEIVAGNFLLLLSRMSQNPSRYTTTRILANPILVEAMLQAAMSHEITDDVQVTFAPLWRKIRSENSMIHLQGPTIESLFPAAIVEFDGNLDSIYKSEASSN